MSGKYTPPHRTARTRAHDMVDRVHDRADDFLDAAEGRAGRIRARVTGAASRASGFLDDVEDVLHRRTGMLDTARDNPLPALGIAFAVGFLLAGSGDEDSHPSLAKAKNQIKGAIMGGISAAVSQQLRSFIEDQGGLGNMLAAVGFPVTADRDERYGDHDDESRDG